MAKILVIGASKGIGLETVRTAIEQGHHVRAFARTATEIPIVNKRLQKFNGDVSDINHNTRAFDDIEVVVLSLGIPISKVFSPVSLFSQATRAVVPIMVDKGVGRLICITGFGAGDSRSSISPFQRLPFRMIFGNAYDDKDVQEQLVKSSGLDWTIVRPGVLTNGRATGRYKVLDEPKDWRNGLIARANVAHFVVGQIDSRSFVHKAPVLIS